MMETHSSDPDKALGAYNRQRAVRTARVQIGSRLAGDYIYHSEGAMADLRNSILRPMTQEDLLDRFEWLYGGTGLDEAS